MIPVIFIPIVSAVRGLFSTKKEHSMRNFYTNVLQTECCIKGVSGMITVLDPDFDPGVDVEREESGTFVLSMNSPAGHVNTRMSIHPQLAEKLRDWLVKNYPVQSIAVNTKGEECAPQKNVRRKSNSR